MKLLSGVRNWWEEQLAAPHPMSMLAAQQKTRIPMCPCYYCFNGEEHPAPRQRKTKTQQRRQSQSLYLLQSTISSYGSLVQERDGQGADQAGAPEDPAVLLDGGLVVTDAKVPDKVARAVEGVEEERPRD